MDATYWNTRYEDGRTGWDLGQLSPPLKAIIDAVTDKQAAILIPGAGSGYEVDYLLQQGFTDVTVIDLAPLAIDRLRERVGTPAGLTTLVGNFFDHQGQYDLILEQTFFCALDPALRVAYAQHMRALLKPGGRVAGVLFATTFPFEGPPFGGSVAEYRTLFEPNFGAVRLEPCLVSVKPRLGNEVWVELRA
ncbi:methyltransferase [Rudanella lutea]|uniref:methyltransferase n=1 Tax=Rudanella lutea TaxID=451374 RepID=UPI00036CE6F6|nr:methyltransferase [Rudanella lutea]